MTDTDPPPPKKAKHPAHERWGTLYARGSPTDELSDADLAAGLRAALDKIGTPDVIPALTAALEELRCRCQAGLHPILSICVPESIFRNLRRYAEIRRIHTKLQNRVDRYQKVSSTFLTGGANFRFSAS